MNDKELAVARKYAQAFLLVYPAALSRDNFGNLCAASQRFKQYQSLFLMLQWPVLEEHKKKQMIKEALQLYELDKVLEPLIRLLADDKRLSWLPAVLTYLCTLYKKAHGIAVVQFSTAHEVSEDDRAFFQQLLVNLTGQAIIYEYRVDKNLIAGVRLQSDTFLWEHSIAQQLTHLKLSFSR